VSLFGTQCTANTEKNAHTYVLLALKFVIAAFLLRLFTAIYTITQFLKSLHMAVIMCMPGDVV